MSWQLTSLVKQHFRGPPALKLLAMNLADYADPEGGDIYPTVATLARDTGISERSCERHMSLLREIGFLNRVTKERGGTYWDSRNRRRKGSPVRYRIDPNWFKSNPAKLAGYSSFDPPVGADTPTRSDANPATAVADKDSIQDSMKGDSARHGFEVPRPDQVTVQMARDRLRRIADRLKADAAAQARLERKERGGLDVEVGG